jgi:hypothetical protein
MAYRVAPGAVVNGSTTSARRKCSEIYLPGGIRTMISGIGVFTRLQRTQRIGIVPILKLNRRLQELKQEGMRSRKGSEIINKELVPACDQ